MIITIIAAVYLIGLMITGLCIYLAFERDPELNSGEFSGVQLGFATLMGLLLWPMFWVLTGLSLLRGAEK